MSGDGVKTTSRTVEAMASQSKETKCFVTGATFIGSHLIDRLVETGTVTVMVKP